MPTRPPPDVAKYLAALPAPHRETLAVVRERVLAALPGATERISYKVPAFGKDGRVVVWMAAFREHLSFFGAYAGAEAAKRLAGKGYVVKGSAIQFPVGKPLAASVVRAVVKARLKDAAARSARPAARRPARAKRTRATKRPRRAGA